ncbi:MAG: ankyrin repeat domain-containing protein [Bryobacterales bacterium]
MQRRLGAIALLLTSALTAGQPDRALIAAAKADNPAAVSAMLERGADANVQEPDGSTALAWAAMRSNSATATALLDAGADANLANAMGVSPLAIAIENGARDIVELLLAHGADPNHTRENGETPLMIAAHLGLTDVMRMLLDAGADPNAAEHKFQQTALMWAAGHPEAVRLLLERGASPEPVTKAWDVRYIIYAPTTFTLGKTGIPWNTDGEYTSKKGGQNALFFAVQKRDLESARALLEAGIDPNQTAADGTSPLLAALYKWVPPEATFVPGKTGPAAAGSSQFYAPDLEMARLLLDHGAMPSAIDGAGYTPLHGAALAVVWATRAGDKGGSGRIAAPPRCSRSTIGTPRRPTSRPTTRSPSRADCSKPARTPIAKRSTPRPARPETYASIRRRPAPRPSTSRPTRAMLRSSSCSRSSGGPQPGAQGRPYAVLRLGRRGRSPGRPSLRGRWRGLGAHLRPGRQDPRPLRGDHASRKRQTILHIAAATLEPDIVAYLAAAGAPLTLENAQGETPLDLADHQERFQESLAKQNAEGDPKKLAAVVRPTKTTDAIKKLLAKRAAADR